MPSPQRKQDRIDAVYYVARRDGDLLKYIKESRANGADPLFLGTEQYHLLWDANLLEPGITTVRIMYNSGRGDEHYTVVDRETVDGIDGPFHEGKSGKRNVKDVVPSKEFFFTINYWKR